MSIKVSRNPDSLTISSPSWTVLHDLKQGGCVTSVTITHGSGNNLLKSPVAAAVDKRFFEGLETCPELDVKKKKNGVTLKFSGVMRSSDDSASPVRYEHSYVYTPYSCHNDLKIIPSKKFKARVITACEIDLDKSLDEYSWGSTDFNKINPRSMALLGPHYDDRWGNYNEAKGTVIEDVKRPWQVSVFARGLEGLCWSGDSKQYQWDSPVSGLEKAKFQLKKLKGGFRVTLSPINIEAAEKAVALNEALDFSWFTILPNPRPTGNRKLFPVFISSTPFPSDDHVKAMAEAGVNVISFMDDIDYKNQTRDYWHDGEFPPYPPEKMKELARFLKLCHSYKIKVIPYFAGKILSPDTSAFGKHAREWHTMVVPNGQIRYHPAAMVGSQGGFMCPDSGWIKFLERYIKRCVDELGFDGFYLDYSNPGTCYKQDHLPGIHNGASSMLRMLENLREWLGDERIMIAHAGGNACWLPHHNLFDGIVTLEEGKRDKGTFDTLEDFPPSIRFMNSTEVSLVPNVFFDRPGTKKTQLLHQGIAHSVLLNTIPYPYIFWYEAFGYEKWQDAFDDPKGIYAAYRKFKDIDFTKYKFHGPESGFASSNRKAVKVATYIGKNDALIVVSNTGKKKIESTTVKVNLTLKNGKVINKAFKLGTLSKFEFVIKKIK